MGSTITLEATGAPANADLGTVAWLSSDELVASVDASSGEVTGVKVGNVTITATSGTITGTADINVISA